MSLFSFLFKKPPYVLSRDDFRQKMTEAGKRASVIDVRTPGEFSGGGLPKAKNINLQSPDFVNRLRKLPKDKMYFVYCRSGLRSKNAVQQMIAEGLDAYSLSGGLMTWK
ncbi:MAG: rhodanese-like domain-containing protein [Cryomorphaceae bacterium]